MAYGKDKKVVGVGVPLELYKLLVEESKKDIICNTVPKVILRIIFDYFKKNTKSN